MKNISTLIFYVFLLLLYGCTDSRKQANDAENVKKETQTDTTKSNLRLPEYKHPLSYDLTIKELMDINIIDSSNIDYEPTYDVSIKDLMALKIVKELRLDTNLGVSYDIPLDDLMKIEIPVQKKPKGIQPTYEMSMQGLLEFQIEEEVNVVDRIEVTYDISLDGLMEIKIKDIDKK